VEGKLSPLKFYSGSVVFAEELLSVEVEVSAEVEASAEVVASFVVVALLEAAVASVSD
jgi:hypothetical protein